MPFNLTSKPDGTSESPSSTGEPNGKPVQWSVRLTYTVLAMWLLSLTNPILSCLLRDFKPGSSLDDLVLVLSGMGTFLLLGAIFGTPLLILLVVVFACRETRHSAPLLRWALAFAIVAVSLPALGFGFAIVLERVFPQPGGSMAIGGVWLLTSMSYCLSSGVATLVMLLIAFIRRQNENSLDSKKAAQGGKS